MRVTLAAAIALLLSTDAAAAVLKKTRGYVFTRSDPSSPWTPAVPGSTLAPESPLEVRDEGEATVECADGSVLFLGSRTSLTVQEAPGAPTAVTVYSGLLIADFAGSFELRTAHGQAAGKSAARLTASITEAQTSVKVRSGKVAVSDGRAQPRSYTVGETALLSSGARTARPGPAPAREEFKRILADPDDVEANLAYARDRVGEGNPRAALIALERVLMVDPNLHDVRLTYAGVLVRLDQLDDAEVELITLRAQRLSEDSARRLDELDGELYRRRRKFHAAASVTGMVDYDHNRNAAPASGQRLVLGVPAALTGANQKTEDAAFTGIVNVRLARDLGRRKHQVFASLNYYRAEQQIVDNLDLQAYSVQYGGLIKTRWLEILPLGFFDHVRLRQQSFLISNGGGLRLQRLLTERLSASLEGRMVYQEYWRTREIGAAPERNGLQGDVAASLGWAPRQNLAVSLMAGWGTKEAVRRYNAYDAATAGLAGLWSFGRGFSLASQFLYTNFTYDQHDPLISPKIRIDGHIRWRTTLSVPLSVLHPALKALTAAQSYEYFHSESNIQNYSYDNNKVSTALTYRWEL